LAHVHLSTEFCKNRLSSFCAILQINKQTNKQTTKSDNITSLADVIITRLQSDVKTRKNYLELVNREYMARSVWLTTVVVPTKIHFKIKAIADILTANLTGLFSGTPWKLFSCIIACAVVTLRSSVTKF